MFIARQPIFNKTLSVYGYELLFRANSNSVSFGQSNPIQATATVLGGLFEIGIEKIVEGKKAFVNFDYSFILSDSIELINPDEMVIEVLEDVKSDEHILERLDYLKSKGYKIALDDYVHSDSTLELLEAADIIKYDVMATPLKGIKKEVRQALKLNKILLAEKIETEGEFLEAKELGFSLFQGYFFSKPSIVGKTNDAKTVKAQYTRVLSELKKEEPSYQILAEIIESDVNLAYRLMKVINNRSKEALVFTIKKALVYMGFKEIERWISVLLLQDLSAKKPKELLRLSLVRSRFAEFVAMNSKYRSRKNETSMMGLFSVLDAILDQTMEDALSDISLTEDIRDVLIKKEGVLSPISQLIVAYETGKWDDVSSISNNIGITEDKLAEGYLESLKWANQIVRLF